MTLTQTLFYIAGGTFLTCIIAILFVLRISRKRNGAKPEKTPDVDILNGVPFDENWGKEEK